MAEYRVDLDIYNGPIDLLLYLIRREEVDIYDIPIARVTEQYVRHVNLLKALDPNLAGEFLVMAATLMEIKTRMLLPAARSQGDGEEDLVIDPRAELVRQLLEYKNFKDAAGDLRDSAELQAMKFPRSRPQADEGPQDAELDIEDVQVWHLLEAFDSLMTAIGQRVTDHEVIYDDTPIELHVADIVDRLQRDGAMNFVRLFEGRTRRSEMIGLFLALLELVRRKRVLASQDGDFADIHIHLNPDPPDADEADEADDRPPGATTRSADGDADGAPPAEADPRAAAEATPQEQADVHPTETQRSGH